MRAGHRQGGGVEGCSPGVVFENHLVGSEFSEDMRTHAHTLSEYPLEKPLEAKLLKEPCFLWLRIFITFVYEFGSCYSTCACSRYVNTAIVSASVGVVRA